MNALILVDVQNDFLPGGALPVPNGDVIIPILNELQPCFDLIAATQDWHPATHESFAGNHPGKKIGDLIDLHGLPQILWPNHCIQGTAGADFAPELNRDRWDRVFVKGTANDIDSYSGFFDNGHRQTTGLGDYLNEKGVTAVYVAGLATEYCVKFTALDAATLGFETFLIEDASRGVNLQPKDVDRAITEMRDAGVKVIQSTTVLNERKVKV